MISVVDYGRGNLFSIGQALSQIGHPHVVIDDPRLITEARCLILPGVGAFGDAMNALRERNMVEAIRDHARAGVPLLGICLGMEILGSVSDEFGEHIGLDLVPGRIRRLPAGEGTADATRIPNVGWRVIDAVEERLDFGDPDCDRMAYFVHSYAIWPDCADQVIATTRINGLDVTAAVRNGNVFGFQFHPEKSGSVGLDLLRWFTREAGLQAQGPRM